MPDFERDERALALVLPYLGLTREQCRRIEPPASDDEYPGLTVDYLATRNGSTALAIEITSLIDRRFENDSSGLVDFCARLTDELRKQHAATARYVVCFDEAASVKFNRLNVVDVARFVSIAPYDTRVETPFGFDLYRLHSSNARGPVAEPGPGQSNVALWALGLVEQAVNDCTRKLVESGERGLGTVLIIDQGAHPDNDAARAVLDRMQLDDHPEQIWACDPSWHSEPTVRLRWKCNG